MPNYLPNAEPFYFPGSSVGCLLIHGFTGTPYEMRGLGERLAAKGYTVLGPVLAGHATCLADMQPTRWPDWYASVTAAYDELDAKCPTVFPIGLSLGGLLALHLAAHHPVAGVVAVSPPFDIHNPLIPLFKVFPFLFSLVPYIRKDPKGNDTQDPTVRAHHPEYDANPTRCAASLLLEFLPHLRSELGSITVPTLLIQSHGDKVIAADSIDRYYPLIGSNDKHKVWVEKSGHLVLEDYAKEQAFSEIQEFIQNHLPAQPATGAATLPDASKSLTLG